MLPQNLEQSEYYLVWEKKSRRCDVMKSLQHPRLLQLYDVYQNNKQICLVLEL